MLETLSIELLLGDYLPELRDARMETLAIVFLGVRDIPIGRRIVRSNSQVTCSLPVRTIVTDALNLGARALIMAHNHPSGNPNPSRADITASVKLGDLLHQLSIELSDHLIVTKDQVYSLRYQNLSQHSGASLAPFQ